MNKMLLIRTILAAVAVAAASALRNCDDCIKIDECTPALQRVLNEKTSETVAILRRAHCGHDGIKPKVCCSDFPSSRSLADNEIDVSANKDISAEEDIERHPNIELLSGECGDLEGNRIIGGSVASLYEFPWLALIAYKVTNSLQFQCGGTVINSNYVMTAAHCIQNNVIVGVRIGENNITSKIDCMGDDEFRECESRYQDIAVSQTFYHNEYARLPQVINDIGLLRLARPVDFSYRNAGMMCLPITKSLLEMDISSERGIVAGWGVTENQQRSNILLKVEVPIQSAFICPKLIKRYYGGQRKNFENVICAGKPGYDSCKGDSGGPLMVEAEYNETYKLVQFGIVSYGLKQCGTESPGVYTDIRKFMKWILDTIKP